MQPIDLTLPLSSDPASHPLSGDARLVNLYADGEGERAKAGWSLTAVDGLDLLDTFADAEGWRGLIQRTDAEAIGVVGRSIVKIDTAGTATRIGVTPTDGPVSMAINGVSECAIVASGLYYGYAGTALADLQITDADLPPPVWVTSLGGYFFFMLEDGRFFASDLNDFGVEGLSYATAEQSPDKGVCIWTRGDDIMAGGSRSIEAWAVTGDSPFPARRVTMVIDPLTQRTIGVLAPGSAVDGFFVASDKTIRMLQSYSAVPISTPAVNRAIENDPAPQNITCTTWAKKGHTFYSFKGSGWTWVYDASTRYWHERRSYGMSGWRVGPVLQFGSKIIAGDATTGGLYELNEDTYTENGSALVSFVQSAPVQQFPYRLAHNALHLDILPGVGTMSKTDPVVMIDWTDDGTHYGTQLMRDLGAIGQTNRQIRVNRLGSSFNRTYRFTVSDNVRRMVMGAKIEASQMGTV